MKAFFSLVSLMFIMSYYVLVIVAARPELRIYVVFSSIMMIFIGILDYFGAYKTEGKNG